MYCSETVYCLMELNDALGIKVLCNLIAADSEKCRNVRLGTTPCSLCACAQEQQISEHHRFRSTIWVVTAKIILYLSSANIHQI